LLPASRASSRRASTIMSRIAQRLWGLGAVVVGCSECRVPVCGGRGRRLLARLAAALGTWKEGPWACMYEGAPNSKHGLAPRMPADLQQTAGAGEGQAVREVREVNKRDRQNSRRYSKPPRNRYGYALRDLAAVQPFSAAA
jgi:hypothetical protein